MIAVLMRSPPPDARVPVVGVELAHAVERATDNLAHAALALRDHVLEGALRHERRPVPRHRRRRAMRRCSSARTPQAAALDPEIAGSKAAMLARMAAPGPARAAGLRPADLPCAGR